MKTILITGATAGFGEAAARKFAAGGWNVAACVVHRLADEAHCAAGCTARIECVYGRDHRQPPDALAFHQAAARRSMLAYARAARKD